MNKQTVKQVGKQTAECPLVSIEPSIQAEYEQMRREGVSHKMAEMLALSQPPQVRSDNTFWIGKWNQFADAPHMGDMLKKEATAAGVDTTGKFYLSGLARFPGDPEAWVSDRGDVQRRVEQRGWGCEGAVNVKPRMDLEPSKVDVADDIVEDRVLDILESHPEPQKVDVGELKHEVKESLKQQRHLSEVT